MLKQYAEDFYQLAAGLQTIRLFLNPLSEVVPENNEEVTVGTSLTYIKEYVLPEFKRHCNALNMSFTGKSLARIERLVAGDHVTKDEMTEAVKDLDRRVRDELSERYLLFVSETKARHYLDFVSSWEPAITRFNIATDVEEAEKCFALDRFSGCVYHLMRVAEIGVQELGKRLGLSPSAVQEPWGSIIRVVREEVAKMPHTTYEEKEQQRKIADAADALWQVNIAWRIPADHPRTPGDSYTEEQAQDAMDRTRALMRHLAAVL